MASISRGVTDHNQVGYCADHARVRGEHLPIVAARRRGHHLSGTLECPENGPLVEFSSLSTSAVSCGHGAAVASGAPGIGQPPQTVWAWPWEYLDAVTANTRSRCGTANGTPLNHCFARVVGAAAQAWQLPGGQGWQR